MSDQRTRRITVAGELREMADHARLQTIGGWCRIKWRELDRAADLIDTYTQNNVDLVAAILRESRVGLSLVEADALAKKIVRAI